MATPARVLQIQLLSDIRDGIKGINKVDKRLGGLSRTLKGLAVTVGLAIGTKELLDYGNAAIKMADDIDQSEGKLKQLLGRHAKGVKVFAKNAKTLGISRRAALQYTGSLSSLMRVQGYNQREAAQSSVRWAKLAADMAAFNNASPEEVLIAMQSALAGEFEPLKRMGVLLSATKVQQEAYRMGIARTGQALNDRQKLLATESLLLKQTSLQQGQLGRETNTLGARQNRLNARLEDLQATIGKFLLPHYANAVDFFGNIADGLLGMATEGWSAGRAIRFVLKQLGVPKEEIDKLSKNFENLVSSIDKGISKGDWTAVQKTLQDSFSEAVRLLQENEGVLLAIGAVAAALGTAFATAMFAVRLFIAAALLPFDLAFWGAKSAVGLAVAAVGKTLGLAMSAAMFLAKLFLDGAVMVFEVAKWAAGTTVGIAVKAVGAALGLAFRGAMFVTSLFITAAATLFSALAGSGRLIAAAGGFGAAMGRAIRTPMLAALGPLGAAILAGMTIDEFLTSIGWAPPPMTTTIKIKDLLKENTPGGRRTSGGFAMGTAGAPRGWGWVGERGPELVRFRGGEKVMDSRSSMRMGGTTVINLTIPVPPTADRAAIGKTVMDAIDAALARGHRFRSPRLTATGPA